MKHLLRNLMLMVMAVLGLGSMAAEDGYVLTVKAPAGAVMYSVDFGKFEVLPADNVIKLDKAPQWNVGFMPSEGYTINSVKMGDKTFEGGYSVGGRNGYLIAAEELPTGSTLDIDATKEGGSGEEPKDEFVINFTAPANSLVYSVDFGDLVDMPADNKLVLEHAPYAGLEIYPRDGFKITSCSIGKTNVYLGKTGYMFLPTELTNGMTITVGVEEAKAEDFTIYVKAESKSLQYRVDRGELKNVPDDNEIVLTTKPELSIEFYPLEGYEITSCPMGKTISFDNLNGYEIEAKELTDKCTIDIEVKSKDQPQETFTINIHATINSLRYSADFGKYENVPDNNVVTLAAKPEYNFSLMPRDGFVIKSCSMGEPYALGDVNGYLIDAGSLTNGCDITLEVEESKIGISEIQSDVKATYYDLMGRVVTAPAQGNLYIVKRGGKTVKVIR